MQPSPRPSARFAFVDLETSGVSPADDRITEVGIVLVDGGQVVDEWASLINPGCAIPAEIQSLTGITNAMVRQAPSFSAVLPDILHRLQDRTFVAHNARFDYGFLKAECRRMGLRFSAEVLCTVRLSRKLQPQFSTHSLDALIARHSLGTGERHRALGDARLIARFFAKLEEQFGLVALQQAIDGLLKRPSLPMHLNAASAALIATLPESPGVYTFLGAQGQALYIGKSRNLRDRVRAHFHADSRNANDARLASETHALQIEPTAGEFSALLKEMQAIKASAPLHNIALRKRAGICLIEANLESKAPRIVAHWTACPKGIRPLMGSAATGHSAPAAAHAQPWRNSAGNTACVTQRSACGRATGHAFRARFVAAKACARVAKPFKHTRPACSERWNP